jgi:hypothetical protein
MKIPFLGKLNKNQSMLVGAGVLGLGILAYLSYSGRRSGFSYLDNAVDQFGNIVDDYGFPVGKVAGTTGGGGIAPVSTPPMSIKSPTLADETAAMLIPSGPGISRLAYNQGISLAPEAYPPTEMMFSGSYFGDFDERDLITVA